MVDLGALDTALRRYGRVIRVVVTEVRGSAPREVGATMLVAECGLVGGTIGGGALELEAIEAARGMTSGRVDRRALGPDLGQCCGGAVVLAYDVVDALPEERDGVIVRRLDGPVEMPLSVRRELGRLRSGDAALATRLIDGWLIDPVEQRSVALWVWGAGHVGRAIIATLAPLPDVQITWVDTAADRFPDAVPDGVTTVPATTPERLVPHAPTDAHHLVLTYSHTLDLALCDALLRHGFASAGLIGSKTKWARFRSRLAAAGHATARIDGITCPIGDPTFGKHPQQIAVGVAARLLTQTQARQDAARDMTG